MSIYMILLIIGIAALLCFGLFLGFRKKKLGTLFLFLTCLSIMAVCALSFKPLLNKINYGLDLQGGFEILYEVSPIDKDDKLTSDMVYNTYRAILKRIDILGVSEPEITIEGENRIRVKLAGVTNSDEAREIISSTASITFRDYYDNLLMTSDVLGGNAKVTQDERGKPAVSLRIKDVDTFYDVTKKVKDMKNNVIVIWLDYQEDTDRYVKEKDKCGSLSDSRCLSAATVDQAFASDVIIQGNFEEEEVENLVELINSGALPTNLEELSSRTVEPTFGELSLDKTLFAGMIGILLVMLIMMIVYRFAGFITSVNIAIYTSLSFLVFYLIEGVLTLPGIAAMLLGIGMAVDASVISYERIKDQLKIGKSLKQAVEVGNKNSFKSIIDANVTTIIVAIILFILGESSVKGFATMLIINVIVTILIMLFFSRFIVKLFVNTSYFDNKLGLFIGINKKKIVKQKDVIIPFKKLDFVKTKKYFFMLTSLIIVIGCGMLLFRGFNFGVDFTGGTSITLNINENVTVEKLAKDLKSLDYTIKNETSTDNDITIVIDEVLEKGEIGELTDYLEDKYEAQSDIYVVSKVVKQELTKNAIFSLIFASIGIVVYVSLRFKFNYAISGIIALLHDVIMVIIFFGICNLEITSIFIAAILTIIGYSINDTIVTFDMIRENYKKKYKNNITKEEELDDLVNDSVRLTLFRTIITTSTTLLPVICMIVMGARDIINFNIALLVGFIVGVYSSIFISNQLWLILEKRRISKPEKVKDDDDEQEELQIKGINC